MTQVVSQFEWPQWFAIVWLFIGVAINAAANGKPKIDSEGQPSKYSFAVSLTKTAMILFFLIAGGFFR